MHFSSILVTVNPAGFSRCAEELETLPGVEVRLRYPDHGRLVVVQETPTLEDQRTGFERIRSVPGVLDAGLVYHHVAPELSPADRPGRPEEGSGPPRRS